MPLFEALLKVTHDCPYANISRKFPSLKMFAWCNNERDVVEVVLEDESDWPRIMEEAAKAFEIVEESSDRGKVHFLVKICTCGGVGSVSDCVEASNLLEVPPVMYDQGWEYYRLIAFRHRDFESLLKTLEERKYPHEILRKVPFGGYIAGSLTLTADSLFSDLTEKQMEALLTAYGYGYYNLPRKADVQTIASKKRMSRTTFQEHLKKGENKLVASLIPYIQLFKHASPDKRCRSSTQ
ncbi:MAG: helix-turn-helix domain-containing protein [Candidatus Bathyarchaeia archaeon]